MGANSWSLDIKGFDELEVRMKKYSSESEKTINRVLREESSPIIIGNIQKRIPVSKRVGQGIIHARNSRAISIKPINLGLKIRPTKKFDYLKYPDLGIGTSKKNQPDEFIRLGLEESIPTIKKQLIEAFDRLGE